jgi:hypothetical protein
MQKTLLTGVSVLSVIAAAAIVLWPSAGPDRQPKLVEVPPLPPITRTSTVVAPTAIAISAIQEAIEASAPRSMSGKRPSPVPDILTNGEVTYLVNRGSVTVAGRPEGLAMTSALSGTFRATGILSAQVGNIGNALNNILGGSIGTQVQNLAGKPFDQHADLRGNVLMVSRPALLPSWRLEPNLAARVAIADAFMTIAGFRFNAAGEMRQLVDKSVNEQAALLAGRIRNDPFLEQAALREWGKLCRAVSLGAAGAGLKDLWLEVRPTRMFAAQPRIEANALTLTVGIAAETRISAGETKPDCPFPAQLDIVAQPESDQVSIGLPIDLPFTEVNRLLAPQLAGRTFPEDGSGAVEVTIRNATLAASGDRLLIRLDVKAREKSWFSLGATATVYVWGRPVLDAKQQILRLTDLALDIESEEAFGLLGAAARGAIPYLKDALAEKAVINLKPFAATARRHLEEAIADFRRNDSDVRVDAAVTDLRLVGIAFDSHTLRVIAEADGTAKVAVSALPIK